MDRQRLLVCGGRNYGDVEEMYQILDDIRGAYPTVTTVITGGASGADSLALMWADERGLSVHTWPADWDAHGRAAGPIRNQKMIDEGKPHMVVAFPGGRGTADMVRRARAAGLPVVEVAAPEA